jgi:hypothetical protein
MPKQARSDPFAVTSVTPGPVYDPKMAAVFESPVGVVIPTSNPLEPLVRAPPVGIYTPNEGLLLKRPIGGDWSRQTSQRDTLRGFFGL